MTFTPPPKTVDEFWSLISSYAIGKYLMIYKKSEPGIITQGRLAARDRAIGVIVLQSDNYPDKAHVIRLDDLKLIDDTRTGSGALSSVAPMEGDWVLDPYGNWTRRQNNPIQ
ncbi:hypothetical protein [Pseudomonas sp. 3-2]|uniref:hypothetical protein n=1 Tax=Pseudomonas sp. 3-2 TaxID=2867408 RepID=UPI001C883ED0|nr:hypothetical protein [Pseudomonas sp. 3-2]QZD73802.1 hypothetical protein K3819_13415 [Pseudomonas sp. 3-2]